AAKTRLCIAVLPLVRRQLNARIRQIEAQLAQIDAAMSDRVAKDQTMARKRDILVSIPGIGEATALAMLVEMPELGTLGAKRAASLAGLAPMTRQSGKWRGRSASAAEGRCFGAPSSHRGRKAGQARPHRRHSNARRPGRRPHPGRSQKG